ncbi:MAG: glycosyltransferase family 4 protein [Clostridia bacterium]|nr:glycosyltransferase family 4 protein [Clostridia bacterium]
MYKVGICGHFGFGKDLANGQTIKTKNVSSELEKLFGEEEICKMDSSGGKTQIIKICMEAFKIAKKCKNVVMLPAHNGLLIFTPLFRLYNLFFKRKLHYVVIGGWLPEYLENHKITRYLLKRFDKIYVETSMMKEKLEVQGFNNVLVMPNFKNIIPVENSKNIGFPVKLCTFSRVLYEKGIEHAIEAVKLLNSNEVICTLDVYGTVDNEYSQCFSSVMKNAPDYVKYKGTVDAENSIEILKAQHILLFPTLYTAVEGFPGTLIDAFAAALPVVAFDWDNNDDIVVNGVNGFLCKEKTAESLAESIGALISNQGEYGNMSRESLNSFKKYSKETVMKILSTNIV